MKKIFKKARSGKLEGVKEKERVEEERKGSPGGKRERQETGREGGAGQSPGSTGSSAA